jgi:hypothetical protein
VVEGLKEAVSAAIEAAKDIGAEATKRVKEVLKSGIEGAEDIIKSLKE